MSKLLLGLATSLVLTVGVACERGSADGSEGQAATVAQGTETVDAPASARPALVVAVTDGPTLKLEEREGYGYTVRSATGEKIGKVKVEADRVKVTTSAEAKAKRKDYGFKVYGPSDAEVLKVKRDGDRYELKLPEGREIGRLDDAGGRFGSQSLELSPLGSGEGLAVARGGVALATVTGRAKRRAAAFLAVTELTLEQRLAMMIYEQELGTK